MRKVNKESDGAQLDFLLSRFLEIKYWETDELSQWEKMYQRFLQSYIFHTLGFCLVDRPTQLICIGIFICLYVNTKVQKT